MRFQNQCEEPIGCKRGGFTLVELLIVLAVIALLAALLFPVFNSVRGKAKMTACASNLHQLHTACALYAADYDTFLPAYTSRATVLHLNGVMTYVEQSRELVSCLHPYIHSQAVWFCPADGQPYDADPGQGTYPMPHVTSYWYHGLSTRRDVPIYPVRIDRPEYPDMSPVSPARADLLNDDMGRPCDPDYSRCNHNERLNIMCFDGHVINERELYKPACP